MCARVVRRLVLGLYHWDDQFKINGPVNASERAAGGQSPISESGHGEHHSNEVPTTSQSSRQYKLELKYSKYTVQHVSPSFI